MGKICKIHGQLEAQNITSQNKCRICVNEWAKNWKKSNRDRVNATNARSKANNPEQWKAFYEREYLSKKERHGTSLLNTKEIARRNGLSIEHYEAMFVAQNNLCAICDQHETKLNRSSKVARLTVDHNHQSGKVRELLCHACNLAIGHARENINIIKSAIAYLENNND